MNNFNSFCESVQNEKDFFKPLAFAVGVGYFSQLNKELIYIDFANVNYLQNYGTFSVFFKELNLAKYKDESEFVLELTKDNLEKILKHFECFNNDGKKTRKYNNFKSSFRKYKSRKIFLSSYK